MWFESIIVKEGLILLLIINLHFINISILLLKINQFACNLLWTSEYILYELREKRMSTRDVDKCKM